MRCGNWRVPHPCRVPGGREGIGKADEQVERQEHPIALHTSQIGGMITMDRLKSTRKKVVGTKQTQKAIEKDQIQVVYVARDADERVVSPIVKLCGERSLELVLVESMSELGKACGIKVGAAAAAALR